jgi:hypothetical protein
MSSLGPRRAFLLSGGALGAAAAVPAAARAAAPPPREVDLLSTYVTGTGYHAAPSEAPRLRVGEPLVLRRRPDNAYDPRTVEVWTTGGGKLGHVPRIDNQALARLMDAGLVPKARVSAVAGHPERPEIRLDVTIAVAT